MSSTKRSCWARVVESGQAPEGGDARPEGRGGGGLEALEQGIGRAEVGENDGAGAAVQAAGLDEVVVGVAVDDLGLEAGHIFSVYTTACGCQEEKRNRLVVPAYTTSRRPEDSMKGCGRHQAGKGLRRSILVYTKRSLGQT